MGQAIKPAVLVVERDADQRALLSVLFVESDMRVVECDTGEAALIAMEHLGGELVMVFADVNLAGKMNGVELAAKAKQAHPELVVVLTSGRVAPKLPADTVFMQKPWRALDVLRVAEFSRH
jgi:DNA-binding NtrC family response regulator